MGDEPEAADGPPKLTALAGVVGGQFNGAARGPGEG